MIDKTYYMFLTNKHLFDKKTVQIVILNNFITNN